MGDLRAIQLLTIPEVAGVLKVSKSWVYDAINKGTLPAHKVGRGLKIRREAVCAFLDATRVQPAGPAPTDHLDPDALIARLRRQVG